MGGKIEQQIYTRGATGYGTALKSPGLTDPFIKQYVHPYCTYPQGYTGEIVTAVNYPCGHMLLGQSVYKNKDISGERSTFFTHNYILPPHMAGQFHQPLFLTEMPQSLESMTAYPPSIKKSVDLKIESTDFLQQHINHIAWAVIKEKKHYLHHGTPMAILPGIYQSLPPYIAHLLGYTYSPREVATQGIHLVFSPKATDSATAPPPPTMGEYIQSLPPSRFFTICNFLHIRLPKLSHAILASEALWLDINLEKIAEYKNITWEFINRGKLSPAPDLYVLLGILKLQNPKKIATALQSYSLNQANHTRIVKNINRIFGHCGII